MTLQDHLDLIETRASTRTAEAVLSTLAGIPFTVVGGWAVYAHGSGLPSVDMDIWYHSDHHEAIYAAFLERHDTQLDTEGGRGRFNLDLDFLDQHSVLFGTDLTFSRSDLQTETKQLLGHKTSMLAGPDLLFSKAKAFHDRSQQWAIRQDPEKLAALRLKSPQEADFIQSRSEAYWLRKAGKDLADVRFLQSRGLEMGGRDDLRDAVLGRLESPHPALVDWANG